MKSAKKWLLPLVLIANDAAVVYFSFLLSYQVRFFYGPFLKFFPASKGLPPWTIYHEALRVVAPLWILVFALWGRLYRKRAQDAADDFMSISKGAVLSVMLIIAATFMYRAYEYSRMVMAIAFFVSILLLFLSRQFWKALARLLYSKLMDKETVLIIGDGKTTGLVAKLIGREPLAKPVLVPASKLQEARDIVSSDENLREVFVGGAILGDQKVLDLLDDCEEKGIEIKILPDLLEMRMGEIGVDDSLRIPILHLKPLSLHGFRFLVKRAFDVSVSILAVSVFFFPLLILSILIVLDSKGGVFFTQERVGFKEKNFKCLKFRTMSHDAEAKLEEMNLPSFRGGPAFKMKGDPRVTRVGKWIRKFSLDEAAQVWNVLRGEMSLIGPRPQVLTEARGNPEWARKRYRILPGITGLWQVSGRADLSYEDMMRLDIYYLENWSPGTDLKILLRTIPVVLGGKGAY